VADAVPPRLLWAVERLSVEPDDHLLEIGCGSGVAVSLICDRLGDGTGLLLFYDAPSESRLETTAERLVATLAEVGLPAAHVEKGRAGSSPVLGVVVRP
jgi:ubiquinone/menaquinone biosynthesis C-methylase UbiE